MDQKNLLAAIAISIAILLGFQFLMPKAPPRPALQTAEQLNQPAVPNAPPRPDPAFPGTEPVSVPPPRDSPRLPIDGPRVSGSISLRGALLDDLVLRNYTEEVTPGSPLVRLLEPRYDPAPNYIQYGWTSDTPGTALPNDNTLWATTSTALKPGTPATLTWDNGAGLVFSIAYTIDDNFMFGVTQTVRNNTAAAVSLHPFTRVRREYEPVTAGYSVLHEGPIKVLGGTLQDSWSYASVKKDALEHNGVALNETADGGWTGITDKYWLTAVIADKGTQQDASLGYSSDAAAKIRYQVGFTAAAGQATAPGAESHYTSRAFAGAKEVKLLNRYEVDGDIPLFSYAVDWGWFFFATKPIFYALDWLYGEIGNFGLAIMVFTVFVKLLFFPLANKSYKSMSKMKLLGPKMAALKEKFKDDPTKLQSEMMGLYRSEKVNPASGCLPMLVQIPVFFSLYKVIFITIEMRHAPFFGWIHDLSALDPTNAFNLFGLIPFDPTHTAAFLHLSAWTLIMGATMYVQQQLNPPPPDPVQARLFKFMPLIFMFMMGSFPAGLLIYWSWNNTLTIAQQWLIMRRTKLEPSQPANISRTLKTRT